MTAQILGSELGNLIQDSKRKNTELRNAAEKALHDLKALPVTSEAQLAADLSRRPHFISPFLIACSSQNAKFGSVGVACLQRLAVSRALPKERLTEVLDSLKDCITLGPDIQLKILQALPPLLQNYPTELSGDLLSTALQICSALQNAKNPAVSNTAAATLQQLVIFIFDRVSTEDERSLEIPTVAEVPGDDGPILVRPAAHDAYKVFHDLNLIINAEKPVFIRFSPLPPTSGLELVESVLSNHGSIMSRHPEQAKTLRTLLMPMVIRSLSDRLAFPVTVRIIRILNLLIRSHLPTMPSELEIALSLLNHMLDPDASTVWKRALCLELFRGLYSDPRLVLELYGHFDEVKGKRPIIGDNLATFVRLATEKPSVIGLGSQSTLPPALAESKNIVSEQAAAEAGGLAGVIAGPVSDPNHTGISPQWSLVKTPCMEHLDKAEPPTLPETYVYSLVLTCITNLSESLAKFVLPLTVHNESRSKKRAKGEDVRGEDNSSQAAPHPGRQHLSRTQSFRRKTVPVNPLSLTDHSAHSFVQTTSALISDCWPAVLATCSTFLNAALDTDYYRGLVRAIQKFTHVAGLLRLSTPRDAFLTTLSKSAVPPHLLLANISSPKTPGPEQAGIGGNPRGLLSVESLVSHASTMSLEKSRSPQESTLPTLSPRNLLCLRALLNIAIALGPTLQTAWSIVFETLQSAGLILAITTLQGAGRESRLSTPHGSRADGEASAEKVEAETAAVQAAARRLFESSVDFPNESFVEMLQALCSLLHTPVAADTPMQTTQPSGRPQILHQRRIGSVSGISLNTSSGPQDTLFALNEIGDIVALNIGRLSAQDATENGWDILVHELVRCCGDVHKPTPARLRAADILARTVQDIAEISRADDYRNETQTRILAALQLLIAVFHDVDDAKDADSVDDINIKIQQIALEALKNVIEQCGESLVAGWDAVFASLFSVFSPTHPRNGQSSSNETKVFSPDATRVVSKQLARSAFGSIQLICSDFLAAVPVSSFDTLLELLLRFCCQQDDLNMSLTSITFFWNVSDFLRTCNDLSPVSEAFNLTRDASEVEEPTKVHHHKDSIPKLWLQVLLNLSAVTIDRRPELRNSAVQTIQRIFENYEDQLTAKVWMMCLRKVLFNMMEANIRAQTATRNSSDTAKTELAAWNETTRIVLNSVSNLFSAFTYKVKDSTQLGKAWEDMLGYLKEFYEFGSHALARSIFNAITRVLSRINHIDLFGTGPVLETAFAWRSYFDHRQTWNGNGEDNQEAFVAYAEAFKAIYQLAGESIDAHILTMLPNLEHCVVDSDDAAYSSDVDHMTSLQKQIIKCLSMVRLEGTGIAGFLMRMLSRFCVLPYTSARANPDKKGPTFVAISKSSMSLLQSITMKHITDHDIYQDGAFSTALGSLVIPIQEKYVWKKEGKTPTLWQKATTTALAILESGLPYIKEAKLKAETIKLIWGQIVNLASGIMGAQVSAVNLPSSLETDEKFDIDAFRKLRSLVKTSLGSSQLPDALRRTYTRSLFQTSLIHVPETGEIPADGPLEDIYKVRRGHSRTPTPTARSEMAYVCFRELISLVSAHEGSTEEIKLAQAAAPYLILRVALPLKSYIADQPLRGRMPAPESQRRELIFALEEMRKMDSEPQSIPDAPGVASRNKKHIHRLYPLLVQAIVVAKYDDGVLEELRALLGIVGMEFGLQME